MNRRGHLSTKIPQVKLRPAPAAGASSHAGSSRAKGKTRQVSPHNMMDEEILRQAMAEAEDEETSTAALRNDSRPWKRVVITFTGVENKPYLTGLAKELGAAVESALTIHVTHVVASGYGSAKYNYAIEHRLPVMRPTWIEAAHDQWVGGDELDNTEMEEEHRLLPFSGLKIAMSGVEPLDRRKQLIKYIHSSGGQYSKDLDRSCTHLISAKPTSEPRPSEKVKWALREIADLEARRRRGVRTTEEEMKIVYEEWVWDCVAYKGRWKEEGYDARKPRRGGRVQAEDVMNGTLNFGDDASKKPGADGANGADAEHHEPAVIRKRRTEGLNTLVGELISTAGPSTTIKSEQTVEGEDRTKLEPGTATKSTKSSTESNGKPSLLHVSRSTSFAGHSKLALGTTEQTTSLPPTAPAQPEVIDQATSAADGPPQFFRGLTFSHVIAEQCDALENALVQHGGSFVSDDRRRSGAKVDYIVVRLCSDVRPILTEADQSTTVVTECWVEGCCFEEKLLSPDKHIVFQPLPGDMPIEGASKLLVHLSGFSAENTVYMRRLLRAIGGTLSVKLNRQTTHLISVLNTGQKVVKAREWGVEVMKDTWLMTMARTGVIEPESPHRHQPGLPAIERLASGKASDLTANMSTVSELPDSSDFARRPPVQSTPATVRPATSLTASQLVSPGRMLKPSPTHVDDHERPDVSTDTAEGSGNGSRTTVSIGKPNNVLSPPRAETERLLNSATPLTVSSVASPIKGSGKEKEKFAKHASAPVGGVIGSIGAKSASEEEKVEGLNGITGRAASMSSFTPTEAHDTSSSEGGTGASPSMTEVLRRLAEKEPGLTGSGKVIRRSRPSARIKSNTATRSPMHSVSPAASRHGSELSPVQSALAPEVSEAHERDRMEESESAQIKYVDAASAREKRRIMAMFEDSDRDGKRARRR
ncbi:hypothetical protein IAU60_002099 [Kwoniella sp. DSM 27419]